MFFYRNIPFLTRMTQNSAEIITIKNEDDKKIQKNKKTYYQWLCICRKKSQF